MARILVCKSIALLLLVAGCAAQPDVDYRWVHQDPARDFKADVYACETITMQRLGRGINRDAGDIVARNMGYITESQIAKCMVEKFGWEKVARRTSESD